MPSLPAPAHRNYILTKQLYFIYDQMISKHQEFLAWMEQEKALANGARAQQLPVLQVETEAT